MKPYTDWTSGEPIEKEWDMTDPALRALLAAQIDHPLPGEPFTDTCILARDVFRILAAAEAAPPTGYLPGMKFGTGGNDLSAEAAPLDVCPDCGMTSVEIGMHHIVAQRALRSPDTETATEPDGVIGRGMKVAAHRPDTETER